MKFSAQSHMINLHETWAEDSFGYVVGFPFFNKQSLFYANGFLKIRSERQWDHDFNNL